MPPTATRGSDSELPDSAMKRHSRLRSNERSAVGSAPENGHWLAKHCLTNPGHNAPAFDLRIQPVDATVC
jgi:hypothetical protein